MAAQDSDSDDEQAAGDFPRTVAGWQLTESSKAADSPGATYHNPHRERVYVNIGHPSAVKQRVWKAKHNPHTAPEEHEVIRVDVDRETVVEAAFEWMQENPAGGGEDGRQTHLTDSDDGQDVIA